MQGSDMKNLLTVVGDGNAAPVLDAAMLAARRFDSHIVGLHSLTTEYAVVFGGEMGFSISSEVDRTLEREGQERREAARALFSAFMREHGLPVGPAAPGELSAEWREESGRGWLARRNWGRRGWRGGGRGGPAGLAGRRVWRAGDHVLERAALGVQGLHVRDEVVQRDREFSHGSTLG